MTPSRRRTQFPENDMLPPLHEDAETGLIGRSVAWCWLVPVVKNYSGNSRYMLAYTARDRRDTTGKFASRLKYARFNRDNALRLSRHPKLSFLA